MRRRWWRTAGRRRRSGLLPASFLTCAAVAAACSDAATGPNDPFAIEFNTLPAAAVVIGDTLRNALGVAVPLSATVYNADGQPIADAPVEFLLPGRGASLLPGNYVFGDSLVAGDTLRVYARAGGLQSLPLHLSVVERPDSLDPTGDEVRTLAYDLAPRPDTSGTVEATVLRHDSTTGIGVAPVRRWLVCYTLVVGIDTIAPAEDAPVFMVNDQRIDQRSVIDTTDTNGRVARRVRVNPYAAGIDAIDSVVVYVSAYDRGAPLPGAPLRYVLRLQPTP